MSSPSRGTPITLADSSLAPVNAELFESITDEQLQDWRKIWVPGTQALRQRLRDIGEDPDNLETWLWDWEEKCKELEGNLRKASFSVVCEGETQGLMIVDHLQKCKEPSQMDKNLVYIQYLEVAPWNQTPASVITPRYRGVGHVLVRAAIHLSMENELHGRIGLRSLPRAERFYREKCGMTDLGVPAGERLRYFEMTPDQARAFIF